MIDIIAAVTSLASMDGCLSIPTSLLRYYHDVEGAEERKTMVTTLGAFLLLVVEALYLLALSLSRPLSELLFDNATYQPFLILGLTSAFFDLIGKIHSVVLRAERRIVQYILLSEFYSFIYAPVALVLVLGFSAEVIGVFIGSAAASFAVFCISVFWARKHFVPRFSLIWLQCPLRYCLPPYAGVLGISISGQANRFILLNLVGLTSVGLYGAAAKVAYVISVATSIISQARLPYTMSQIKSSQGGNIVFTD